MSITDWKRVVDEAARHSVRSILVRGGEPFLLPGIIELLDYIHDKGIFVSVDTNGTTVARFAEDLVRIGEMHMTFSVDGPEDVHDQVRNVKGSFAKTRAGIARILEAEAAARREISKSICFTISSYNYESLGQMPDVARHLGIRSLNIVPYYYFPDEVGRQYESELREDLGCVAFSWQGFHHEDSGVDIDILLDQYHRFLAELQDLHSFPYMPLTEDEYRQWFTDATTVVVSPACNNVEKLIDIQPDGSANFCVDFPDYSFGNVREATIEELWNGAEAERFREYRRVKPLAICHRCGAKYMSELEGKE
jgi:MoaA/NifB/PqqE/SkfB family radical SAM enzyme